MLMFVLCTDRLPCHMMLRRKHVDTSHSPGRDNYRQQTLFTESLKQVVWVVQLMSLLWLWILQTVQYRLALNNSSSKHCCKFTLKQRSIFSPVQVFFRLLCFTIMPTLWLAILVRPTPKPRYTFGVPRAFSLAHKQRLYEEEHVERGSIHRGWAVLRQMIWSLANYRVSLGPTSCAHSTNQCLQYSLIRQLTDW